MFAELLREAGILTCVFGVLDGVLHGLPRGTALIVLGVGAGLTVAGIVLERTRN
jgi:hypothetical protein